MNKILTSIFLAVIGITDLSNAVLAPATALVPPPYFLLAPNPGFNFEQPQPPSVPYPIQILLTHSNVNSTTDYNNGPTAPLRVNRLPSRIVIKKVRLYPFQPGSVRIPVSNVVFPQYSYKQYKRNGTEAEAENEDGKEHSETRDGGLLSGKYSLIEQGDGAVRTVTYVADDGNGFQATVTVPVNQPVPVIEQVVESVLLSTLPAPAGQDLPVRPTSKSKATVSFHSPVANYSYSH